MPRQNPQTSFDLGRDYTVRREHGGDVREGRRKLIRPLDSRQSLHVVMRSSRAKGDWSLLHRKNRSRVERLIYVHAAQNNVTVDRLANVGNHLHLLIRFRSRHQLQVFFRVVTGLIARSVTGAKKGLRVGRFWDSTFYSRLVTWGRELIAVQAYFSKNRLEAVGFRGARLRFTAAGDPRVVVGQVPRTELSAWSFLSEEQKRWLRVPS